MITLQPPIPSAPASLETLSNFLELFADPPAAKQRVSEMIAATASMNQSTADQKAAIAAFTIAEADHKAALAQQAADAAAKLSQAQAAFDTECARRKSELDDRAARLTELESQAAADAKAAAAAKTDFLRRLTIIKSATG